MNIITSGIKNALERGESVEQASRSFQNAGYKEEEILKAVEEIKKWGSNQSEEKAIGSNAVKEEKSEGGYKKLPKISLTGATNKIYLPYILIVLLGLLFVAGAALLGIYWNKLF